MTQEGFQSKQYQTPRQLADELGKDVSAVIRWIRKGVAVGPKGSRYRVKLNAYKVGGQWRIPPDAMADFQMAATYPAAGQSAQNYIPHRSRSDRRGVERAVASLVAQGAMSKQAAARVFKQD